MPLKCGFTRKECMEAKCVHWREFTESNATTGEARTRHACVWNLMLDFLQKSSQEQRGIQKAIESFRNDTVKVMEGFVHMAIEARDGKK